MLDLQPATIMLTAIVEGVRDDQLTAPTPCTEATVGGLLDHVDGLALAFTAAARKSFSEAANQAPSADASRLGEHWRPRIRDSLQALASAWRDQAAWEGMTKAGGLDLPARVAGVVVLNEVTVHGWDIAVASGQRFEGEPQLLEAALGFVQGSVAQNPHGSPGLFGAPVPVPDDAPLLDRLIGLTGRDPAWRAPEASRQRSH